ncbi:MAG TPA: PSD1 and planctomycete cytochrome C domain-containing protein [Verrucomicrobium sp.]|nr:PSD1 and planctomycete cytochrome C domain-containing protein [Verrucomicrobium sp.]
MKGSSLHFPSHRPQPLLLAGLTLAAGILGHAGGQLQAAATLTYEKDVRPILKAHCFHCHGEDGEVKGGLDVRLRRFLAQGGKSGPAIVPGKAHDSLLLEMLNSGEMPKGAKKLSEKEITTISQWVTQGATTARPEPEKLGPEFAFTDEERSWWAFQPISSPPVPDAGAAVSNPIDAFLIIRLHEAGLEFSREASRATLIRRATFDLTGLPPTPEEVSTFIGDDKPGAYERLITRLLDSPRYGERWGRHWLDVAGYADSDGYTEKDTERLHAFRFRDYVIKSLNEDKPFDQFVREQLAGDEMVRQPYRNLDEEAAAKLAATGFLRMAPDGTGVMDDTASRNAVMADTIKIVSTSLYGMTIQCAQCHDHRYDPISHADYHRLRAVLEPALDWKKWKAPNARLVSLMNDTQRAEAATIEVEAKKIDEVRLTKQAEFIDATLEKELAKREENLREPLRTAYKTEVKKRTPEQVKLLSKHPSINKLTSGSLYLYDTTYKTNHAAELRKMTDAAAVVRATKPKEEFVQALTEPVGATVPVTYIFHRGDPEQPKAAVTPGDLTVLSGQRKVDVPAKDPTLPTSGRRLAFAKSLTDGSHPLLARVMVNRVWMHHFGRGIVPSVGDFGHLGQLPSHPELLDWLAGSFMKEGWSLKKLHFMLMTSAAYRQASTRDSRKEQIDPDNALVGRMNVHRLEAESLRDAMVSVAGKLTPKMYGPPVPIMYNEEGQVVVGIDTTDTAGRQTGKVIPLNGEEYRRSLYIQARRTRPLGMLETFDAPSMMEANCAERPRTTVSPQSLMLMNNGSMREYAQHFAGRLQKEEPTAVKAQVQRAYELAYGRTPSEAEITRATEFVQVQTEYYKTHPAPLEYASGPASKTNAAPDLLGLAALCHALMSANEFLYVD